MINVRCNLCGHDNWRVRYPSTLHQNGRINVDAFRCTSPGYGRHAQIVDCLNCGFVYANPRWSDDELMGAYEAVEDATYVAARQGREWTFKRHLGALEKQIEAGNGRSLLDVGAYIGIFVEIAAVAGWDACGVEPSEWAAAEAQKQGINVVHGTQDVAQLRGRQFDVVTMWDVIEHVDRLILRNCSKEENELLRFPPPNQGQPLVRSTRKKSSELATLYLSVL